MHRARPDGSLLSLAAFPFNLQAHFKVVFKRLPSEMLMCGKTCGLPGLFVRNEASLEIKQNEFYG